VHYHWDGLDSWRRRVDAMRAEAATRSAPELAAALGGLRAAGGAAADPALLRLWTAVDRRDDKAWRVELQGQGRWGQQPSDPPAMSASPGEAMLKCSHAVAQLATSLRFIAAGTDDGVDERAGAGVEAGLGVAAARMHLEAAATALTEPLRVVSMLGSPVAAEPLLLELAAARALLASSSPQSLSPSPPSSWSLPLPKLPSLRGRARLDPDTTNLTPWLRLLRTATLIDDCSSGGGSDGRGSGVGDVLGFSRTQLAEGVATVARRQGNVKLAGRLLDDLDRREAQGDINGGDSAVGPAACSCQLILNPYTLLHPATPTL
jgi:hypothetical protein